VARALLSAIMFVAAMAGGGLTARWAFMVPGPLPESRDVVVPRGGAVQVAETLRSADVIVSKLAFRLAVIVTAHEGPLHAAELAFPAHASLHEVLAILRTARPVEHRLTIPEGLTARQITALLDRADALTGTVTLSDEGAVLPDTYSYERGTTRAALLARAEAAAGKALAAAWADRDPGLKLASPRDALILASIVERETAKPEERAHVAAVFLNRLRLGMRLQADSTVVYAASGGFGVLDHPLTRGDLEKDSPYNTYRHPGLPPGPICAPGIASLRAVLHPAASGDLYFVANGTGGHVFAPTLAQHEANVKRWRSMEAP
jgi:peptidoglycan lytic transglycosylase G